MSDVGARWLAAPIAAVYRRYYGTLKIIRLVADGTTRTPDQYPFSEGIYAVSERDSFALAGVMLARRFTVLVTLGRDGDWVGAVFQRLGCTVVRGSSKRGGAAALAAMIRDQEASPGATAIVVDGPLGPVGVAKPGAAMLAARTGRPLLALGAAASRAYTLRRTWAGMFIPLPYTVVAIATESVDPPQSMDEHDMRAATDVVTAALRRTRERAQAVAARTRV